MSNISPEDFIFHNLKETGRIQFFYHSPSSKLPVRDVLNEQKYGHKTEPHIEIGAENYISSCYQSNNIIPFLKSPEKYLFLVTNCRDKEHKYFGKKCIVGYIRKTNHVRASSKRFAVRGDIFIYSFDNSLPFKQLDYSENVRMKKVDENDTKMILNHFKDKENILLDCIKEIMRLDKKNILDNKTCKVLRGSNCDFQNECLRWNH
ncbi:MAG: hypothetical protein ACP6IY_14345 [Promethearchaeia archaeon]